MARNENTRSGKHWEKLPKGTLKYTGSVPDYGEVSGYGRQPVTSNRTVSAPQTSRGSVKSVANMKP